MTKDECRTSHEVRGLKCFFIAKLPHLPGSHLTRGAWIEIPAIRDTSLFNGSHLTRGAWIEMLFTCCSNYSAGRSHLTRGAWIEIALIQQRPIRLVSHLTRGAWIEIRVRLLLNLHGSSHLTRGAWIEISSVSSLLFGPAVAPHTRCVD